MALISGMKSVLLVMSSLIVASTAANTATYSAEGALEWSSSRGTDSLTGIEVHIYFEDLINAIELRLVHPDGSAFDDSVSWEASQSQSLEIVGGTAPNILGQTFVLFDESFNQPNADLYTGGFEDMLNTFVIKSSGGIPTDTNLCFKWVLTGVGQYNDDNSPMHFDISFSGGQNLDDMFNGWTTDDAGVSVEDPSIHCIGPLVGDNPVSSSSSSGEAPYVIAMSAYGGYECDWEGIGGRSSRQEGAWDWRLDCAYVYGSFCSHDNELSNFMVDKNSEAYMKCLSCCVESRDLWAFTCDFQQACRTDDNGEQDCMDELPGDCSDNWDSTCTDLNYRMNGIDQTDFCMSR